MRREDNGSGGSLWSRRIARVGAVALAVTVVGLASPASAHVTVTPSTTAAGAHAVLQFSVAHGCADSPTTGITIQIPAQITSVTPTRNAWWQVSKRTEKVDPPVTDAHGNQIVERVTAVTYRTDTPLPDGYRDVLELAVQLPETPGTDLLFPTVQTCATGESAWIEVPQNGQTLHRLDRPAPGFVVSAGIHHAAETPPAPAPAPGNGVTLAALLAGLVGSALAAVSLFQQHRRA
ncbi:YcnI family copper-binding membrane protein [Actinoplanes sichuanensis]|uniref:YcnI family protein n=1 Tax=Actinoplanes sichuanensis TaxID=512349 RepID=A0ABW4AB32_9ACTN|nr:YcnI family protein [Actinoplanes sichuanensis]